MINKNDIKLTLDFMDIMKKEYNDINVVGSFNIVIDALKDILNDFEEEDKSYELSLSGALKSVKKVFKYLKNNNKKNKILIESIDIIIDTLEME